MKQSATVIGSFMLPRKNEISLRNFEKTCTLVSAALEFYPDLYLSVR
jgi:hypothetical protein